MMPMPLPTGSSPGLRRRARCAAERGSMLLASLLIAMMLAGLSVGLLSEGFAARANVARSDTSMRALEVAEVGLAKAELELASMLDPDGDGVGTLAGTWAGGTYQITMSAADPMVERFTARAVGVVGNSRREIEVGLRRRSSGAFIEGLFSVNDLTFGGNSVTDAYDTRVGTYAAQAVNTDAYGAYADLGGNLGSNTGFITLMGSSVTVRGDAVPGPGRSVYEYGNPVVTGDTAPREDERAIPPTPYAEFSAAATSNNNESWGVAGKEPDLERGHHVVPWQRRQHHHAQRGHLLLQQLQPAGRLRSSRSTATSRSTSPARWTSRAARSSTRPGVRRR